MTAEELAKQARAAFNAGTHLTLVRVRGARPPPGFPRSELLCENYDGRKVYSYDPKRVLAFVKKFYPELVEDDAP